MAFQIIFSLDLPFNNVSFWHYYIIFDLCGQKVTAIVFEAPMLKNKKPYLDIYKLHTQECHLLPLTAASWNSGNHTWMKTTIKYKQGEKKGFRASDFTRAPQKHPTYVQNLITDNSLQRRDLKLLIYLVGIAVTQLSATSCGLMLLLWKKCSVHGFLALGDYF